MIVEFRAKLKGLTAKEGKNSVEYAVALDCKGMAEETAAAIMREIGESVHVTLVQPQERLPLKPPKSEYEQATLDDAVAEVVAGTVCDAPAVYRITYRDLKGEELTTYLCDEHAEILKPEIGDRLISVGAATEGVTCWHVIPEPAGGDGPSDVEDAAQIGTLAPCGNRANMQDPDSSCWFCDAHAAEYDPGNEMAWKYDPGQHTCGVLVKPTVIADVVCPVPGIDPQEDGPFVADANPEPDPEAPATNGKKGLAMCICGHSAAGHEDKTGWCWSCSCPAFVAVGGIVAPDASPVVEKPEPTPIKGKRKKSEKSAASVFWGNDAVGK